MLSANMDDAVKREFTEIVGELGMNATTAVNLFARSVIRERGLPFFRDASHVERAGLGRLQSPPTPARDCRHGER